MSSSGLVYMGNELRQGAQFPTLIFIAKDADFSAWLASHPEAISLSVEEAAFVGQAVARM